MIGARSLLLLLAALVALAPASGCTLIPQVRVPETVRVNVPVPCVDPATRPQRPTLRTEADLWALTEHHRTLAAWRDLLAAHGYLAELEAVVEGCSRIPATSRSP